MPTLEELRFPIGQFTRPKEVTPAQFDTYIQEIERFPYDLRESVSGLTDAQLDTPYREGGWTIRQVVHHLFDSHANSYIRLKLALTEDHPTIRPYDEATWAELDDAKHAPIELSLNLIEDLHKRWIINLRKLTPEQKERTYNHPESGVWRIDQYAAMYAWHGKHHRAHITGLKQRMGW
jgi:hypothetical protein